MTDLTSTCQAVVAILLVASGVLSLIAALGLLQLPDFFRRMHAPALTSTLGTWCVALASVINFSFVSAHVDLRGAVIVILLALTAPVTTTLLARATLFRQRSSALISEEVQSSRVADGQLLSGTTPPKPSDEAFPR